MVAGVVIVVGVEFEVEVVLVAGLAVEPVAVVVLGAVNH